jgi:hypothetical protein
MLLNVYSFYDSAAQAYLQPFFLQTDQVAKRTFTTVLNDPEHNFTQAPADYTLFKIGIWSDETGIITKLKEHLNLGNGLDNAPKPAQTPLKPKLVEEK